MGVRRLGAYPVVFRPKDQVDRRLQLLLSHVCQPRGVGKRKDAHKRLCARGERLVFEFKLKMWLVDLLFEIEKVIDKL